MSALERHGDAQAPRVQLLSNGSYHVMLTDGGAGYSRWRDLALTRWREDATCDNWGAFCYVRDLASGEVWSATLQPTLRAAGAAETVFTPGHAIFNRSDGATTTQLEIAVSPQDDVEVRRLRITNRSDARREFAVTSYAEIVLAPPATDAAHPAFSKLFLQTEIVLEHQAILCTRRPRAPEEPTAWWFHLLASSHSVPAGLSYETDRMRFIGRGRSTADPQALDDSLALGGSAGAVLDAVAAIRCCVTLEAAVDSDVETFCALRLFVDSWRWAGVPWYLRSGKCLPMSAAEVLVQLKPPPQPLFGDSAPVDGRANYFRFRLSPTSWIALAARVKQVGKEFVGDQRELYLCEDRPGEELPYERLLRDAMAGDGSLFSDQDAVEAAWAVVEPVLGTHHAALAYAPGTWGPAQVVALVADDGGWHEPAPEKGCE